MLNRVLGGVTGCDVGVTEEKNGEGDEEKEGGGGGEGGKEEEEKGKIGAGWVNGWEAKAP